MWQAILSFIVVISFNILSILIIYLSITHEEINNTPFFLNENNSYFGNRFYILIVDIVPLFTILYIIYRVNKKKIETYFNEFDEESEEIKKKRNRGKI